MFAGHLSEGVKEKKPSLQKVGPLPTKATIYNLENIPPILVKGLLSEIDNPKDDSCKKGYGSLDLRKRMPLLLMP